MATKPLEELYLVTTPVTITYPSAYNMKPEDGEIYATDPTSNTLTIKHSLTYTTTSFKTSTLNLAQITFTSVVPSAPPSRVTLTLKQPPTPLTPSKCVETFPRALAKIETKDLEKREKHQLRLAEEFMSHQNTEASPSAVACYDALLKSCSQVEWTNITRTGKRQDLKTNILVMKEMGGILVVEPYDSRGCVVSVNIGKKGVGAAEKILKKESLERVRKIIEARGEKA
ncbi:hypothetical protein TrVE_jg9192 [Triparma verrucosa]|uniref:AD domain-containing protein n=1 Tax=Triparma verrucosa TaxID=1606542 RepID=A0A9W7CM55_9STRA|nr:hypothetical protein TrVE_jg9192 [Triparma verrucosa]